MLRGFGIEVACRRGMSTKEMTSTISLLIEALGSREKAADEVSPYLKELFRKYLMEGEDRVNAGLVAGTRHRGWTIVEPS
jgi:hypothetical protein